MKTVQKLSRYRVNCADAAKALLTAQCRLQISVWFAEGSALATEDRHMPSLQRKWGDGRIRTPSKTWGDALSV